jgi:hypothetical protein
MTWSSFSVRMCRTGGIPSPFFPGYPPSRDKVYGHGWLFFSGMEYARHLLSSLHILPNRNQKIDTRSSV